MKIYLLVIFFTIFKVISFGQVTSVTPLPAQTPDVDTQPIKVNTYLVNVPIIASDRDGRYVSGLTKDNFTVRQDGEKLPIEFFANEQTPMNVAILIDSSVSTRGFIGDILKAAKEFVKVLRPEDQALAADFDSVIKGYDKFTSDQKKLLKSIDKNVGTWDRSSNMQDAIYRLVTKVFPNIKGRKAIIVLTDGYVSGDISNKKLLSLLQESDVLVYPILFGSGIMPPRIEDIPKIRRLPDGKVITREQALRNYAEYIDFFESLGTLTGGRLYKGGKSGFKKIFLDIADELKNLYSIGFYLQNVDDEKTHNILITASPKHIVIRSRRNINLKTVQ